MMMIPFKIFEKLGMSNFRKLSDQDRKDLYALTNLALKQVPQSPKQKATIAKINKIRAKGKMELINASTIKEGDGLWANIHKKRKSGKRMRKPGEKGAPTKADFKRAKGEEVEEAKAMYKKGDTVSLLSMDRKERGKAKVKSVTKAKPNNQGIKNFYITNKGTFSDMEVVGTPAYKDRFKREKVEEGKGPPESFEAQFKRRVVATTKPEHKEKGYKWRIKGKDRPEISIKLYKNKPDFSEFKKQLRRVAGHEFG
jgi:hypothetical protein